MKLGKHAIVVTIAAASLGLGVSAMAQASARTVPIQPYVRNFVAIPAAQTGQQSQHALNRKRNFVGTVVRSKKGYYVLEVGGMRFRLNDQSDAAKYVGKQVRVTGTLNTKTETIYVTHIQPTA